MALTIGGSHALIPARLDKSGARVICGWPNCGRELAAVNTTRGPSGQVVTRTLTLPPGWKMQTDGTYLQARHAARRERHLQQKVNHGRVSGQDAKRGLRLRRAFLSIEDERNGLDARTEPRTAPLLPCTVVCPNCHHPNRLEAKTLKIVQPEK